METTTGVLLVNLGTPDTPKARDVYRYLIEFLTDSRVIDLPWWRRQLLVRGIIVPSRFRQSARLYQALWTKEGSPLKANGYRLRDAIQNALGEQFHVELAMRYQQPTIASALDIMLKKNLQKIIIVPLFPQYASATTGSVYEKVMEELMHWEVIPELIFVGNFATHPGFIRAFCAVAQQKPHENYDHILFSFHGLPERQLLKADQQGCCLKTSSCCQQLSHKNRNCYAAQCYATAHSIAKQLGIAPERFSICFQSRLGKDPWLQPYASDVIEKLAKAGKKRLLAFSPSFVSDCLETTYEIGVEYAKEFLAAGGECLDLVPSLNDHPLWIEALKTLIEHKRG